ncbi:MAG: hypothetical protein MZW92_36810 [Comamonadaceae bacterium]|nr:hypothetical protein [Comamonadaceae bacterium]
MRTVQRRLTGNVRRRHAAGVGGRRRRRRAALQATIAPLLRERRKLAPDDDDNFNVLDTQQIARHAVGHDAGDDDAARRGGRR